MANISQVQQAALRSRLHIPVIFSLNVIHGYRTIFPVPIAEASSWDPAAVQNDEAISADEATYPAFGPGLVRSGQFSLATINNDVRHVLTLKYLAGMFDHPLTDPARVQTVELTPAHLAVARTMAARSMVLLNNHGNAAPQSQARRRHRPLCAAAGEPPQAGFAGGLSPIRSSTLAPHLKESSCPTQTVIRPEFSVPAWRAACRPTDCGPGRSDQYHRACPADREG